MADVTKIDESLYSRQLYVMGHEAQRRMAGANVLVVGMNGLGVETAKNVILAGVKSVSLHDSKVATWSDLSSNFYIQESDLGKNRAEICAPKLSELNPYVPITVLDGELAQDKILQYRVVVLIDIPMSQQIDIADFCHNNNICVIISDVFGVFGNIFCDFGKDFICYDINGEPNASSMVAAITNDTKACITCLEDQRHHLETGDVVTINDIHGIPELNGNEYKVTVKDPYSFEIDVDTTGLGIYQRGGYVNQVKQPEKVQFQSMSETLNNPGMFNMDWVKLENGALLHLGFQALQQFRSNNNNTLPSPGNAEHAQAIYDLTLSLNTSLPVDCGAKINPDDLAKPESEKLIKRLSMCSQGLTSPICALIGGIVGQEVLKACSGKFMPIKQWFYYDAIESLSEEPLPESEVTPIGSRYDGQIMVYGRTMQQQIADLKIFVVGAGAIGCEMMKNFAMMGVSCSDNGMVHITDMDQIEKSNLSRQFLFRNTDINQAKSTTSVKAVTKMNPNFRSVAYEHKVASDTENIFGDDFYDELDLVFTALDNVEARLYVDQRCVFFRKPMFESGTLGTKGSTQVVVPGLTEHYGATRDPPEKSIAICTLKHFPNLIEHTLAWSRDWFEEAYKQMPDDAQSYLSSPDFQAALANQQNMKLDALKRIKEALLDMKPDNFNDCIRWSRLKFEDMFTNKIKQLLHNFPLDKQVPVNGGSGQTVPFWTGAKKPPKPLEFDANDELHIEFILTAANLRAKAYGISSNWDKDAVTMSLSDIHVTSFVPSDGVAIPATDEEAKAGTGATAAPPSSSGYVDIDEQCAQVLDILPARESFSSAFKLDSFDFEKDDDEHMRVIAAVSNLRARNYSIPEVDLHKSRGIAGNITPAIATTTALVTGAICVEMYKVLQKKPIEQLMSSFSNLALPLFTHEEPGKPVGTKVNIKGKDWEWSIWDRIEIDDPSMTLEGLITYIDEEYDCELSMLSTGVSILYTDYMAPKKVNERKPMILKDLTELVTKKTLPNEQKFVVLEVLCNDNESGDEVDLPSLRFRVR